MATKNINLPAIVGQANSLTKEKLTGLFEACKARCDVLKLDYGKAEPLSGVGGSDVVNHRSVIAWVESVTDKDKRGCKQLVRLTATLARRFDPPKPQGKDDTLPLTAPEVEAEADDDAGEPAESPVADVNADEAIDQIGRMRSVEKLESIVADDERPTVRQAAENRLKELSE